MAKVVQTILTLSENIQVLLVRSHIVLLVVGVYGIQFKPKEINNHWPVLANNSDGMAIIGCFGMH